MDDGTVHGPAGLDALPFPGDRGPGFSVQRKDAGAVWPSSISVRFPPVGTAPGSRTKVPAKTILIVFSD